MSMKFKGLGGGTLMNVGVAGLIANQQYSQDRSEGKSTLQAGADAAAVGFWTASLSMWGGLILPAIPAAVKQAISFGQQSSVATRARTMPFSQRYEHSDAAARMQQYSLSRMSEMEGFGNEASAMNGRYGRG